MSLNKNTVSIVFNPETGIHEGGYKFKEDNILNILAFIFGGNKGEKKAEEIYKKSQEIKLLPERRKFIENEVKKEASNFDKNLSSGIGNLFSDLRDNKNSFKDKPKHQVADDRMLKMMTGLGLNVSPDNCTTSHKPSPPQPEVLMVMWVNRPTTNLGDSNSSINRLFDQYLNTLELKERDLAIKEWSTHQQNAKNGEPKIPKQQFILDANKQANSFFKESEKHASQGIKSSVESAVNEKRNEIFNSSIKKNITENKVFISDSTDKLNIDGISKSGSYCSASPVKKNLTKTRITPF